MAQNIEIPVSLGLKDAQSQINQLRQALQQSVKLDSSAGKGLTSILDSAQRAVDKLTGKMSNAFKSVSGSQSFLKDYEKMIELLTTATQKMTNLGVTDIKFSVSDQQVVDSTIQKIQSLQQSLESIQSGKAIEVINMSSIDGIDNLRQQLDQLKIDASKLSFNEIGEKLSQAAAKAESDINKLNTEITKINSQIATLNTQGFQDIAKLSESSTKGVSRILDAGNVDAVNDKLQKLAATMTEITVKPMTVTSGQNIESIIETQTKAIEKQYNQQIQTIQTKKDQINSAINSITERGMRTANNGKTSYGHWTNEQMQNLMSMPSVQHIIERLKADTSLNFDSLGIRQQFAQFREALNQELNSLNTQEVNLQTLRDNVRAQVTEVFEGAGESVVGSRSQLQNSIKNLFSNLGINGDELKKIFDINSISSGEKMLDVIERIKAGLADYISTLEQTANTDLTAKLKEAQASFDNLTNAQATNQSVSQESGNAAQTLQEQINTLAQQVQDLINKYNELTGQHITFDNSGIEGARNHIEDFIQSLTKLQQKQKALSNVQMAVNRWMGFWQVLNMAKSAINDMKKHIQELDTVMTSISVVTNFSQEDLWGQISQYSEIARQYGVAIKGVYEVSQIYYQQGLQQNDVMTLTTETLKMARIAGLDYATAADYMTTAIRGFKLEMTDAAHVTDVFSALAATTASSTEEIATAISKTASSAEAVGASFEATSAMMATMISTTRESATNIGTALKSVISRYGEMTGDPSKTVDSEGEEMSLNRVDKALQTVGITIHDTAGQFRNFDDVMLELMEKWDSLDSLSQRYIATLMAGNRQQSRFLALVSNVDEYKKALETAMNSEGTGELQTLKTLDSIDAKIEKMKVTIQEFYTSSGIEELYKSILDSITNIVSAANSLPKAFGKIPLQAVSIGAALIAAIKSAISLILMEIQIGLEQMKGQTQSSFEGLVSMIGQKGSEAGQQFAIKLEQATSHIGSKLTGIILRNVGSIATLVGSGFTIAGLNTYGASTDEKQDQQAGVQTLIGGGLGVVGSALSGAASGAMMGSKAGPHGMAVGAIIGTITGLVKNFATLKSGLDMYNVSLEREIQLSEKRLENAKTNEVKVKQEEKQLEQAYNKLEDLQKHQYDSVEAMQEYHEYMNQLADSYPQYIESIEANGQIIIDTAQLENDLAAAREASAAATLGALRAEENNIEKQQKLYGQLLTGLNGVGKSLTNNTQTAMALHETYKNNGQYSYVQSPTAYIAETFLQNLIDSADSESLKQAYSSELQRLYSATSKYTPNNKTAEQKAQEYLQQQGYYGQMNTWASEEMKTSTVARRQYKNVLNEAIKNSGNTLTLQELTGYDIESVDELTVEQFLDALEHTKNIANNYLQQSGQTLDSIEKSIHREAIDEKITRQVNELKRSQEASDLTLSSTIETYSELYGFMLDAHFKDISPENISSEAWDEAFTEVSKWITENTDAAEALMHIDYSSYASFDDLKSDIKNIDQLDESFITGFKESWERDRLKITTLYQQQLTNIFGSNIPDILQIFDKNGNDQGKFNTRTITSIQSHLAEYSDLIEKEQYAEAEAYSNNMLSIYEAILNPDNKLTKDEQTQAFDTIKDLDLSDSEALYNISDVFVNMGGNFNNIASIFTTAASRWAINAATLLESLMSSIQETAKSIESSIADMGKVFKYSEALEKAQALMDANEGVKFDELFTYDKDLGGYIKTAKAFQLEMAELQNQQIEGISLAITDMTETLSSVFDDKDFISLANSGRTIETGQVKEKFAVLTHTKEGDANFDRLWLEYTQIIEAFRNQDKDWNTFITEYISENGTQLQLQLDEINNMSSQMAQLQLKSFDYTSIVSGKGTAQTKETLKALLIAAGGEHYASDIDQFFDEYYTKLITGNVKEYNNYLKHFGLSDFEVTESQANRARFESLTSLYDKIASGDVVWDALTEQEQELLNSVEGVNLTKGASAQQVGAAADNVWAAIIKLIQAGAGTLKEVADTIAEKADKAFKNSNAGKQYNLLTSYKDGFTSSEAEELGLLNDDGTLKAEFASYLERDSNGNWVTAAGQNAASVIQNLARLLNISIDKTTDEYKDAIKDGIDQAVVNADKADIGKQRVDAWQSIMSGKVSDRISLADVDATTKSYMQAAGLISDMNADFVYIQSEEQLNNAIEWMRDKLSDQSFVQRNQQTARYFQQLVSDFESKTAKNAAFEGIIGEQFDQSAAEALSMALQNTTEYSKVQSLMTEMGFKWDQAAQVWKASAESIEATRNKIRQAFSAGEIDNETYLNLTASLNETAEAINPKTKQDNALLDMLQNYNNVSEAMRAAFINNFYQYGIKASDFLTKNDNGTYDVNVGALKSFLDSIGFEYDEAAMSQIQAITDSYLSNIQTATTYTTQGASSLADVEAFKQSYKELVGTELGQNAFSYDTIQNSFVLDASYMQKYVEAQKQKLLSMGYAEDFVNTYVQDQTDNAIRENIVLDGFLNAESFKERNDEANKLIQQIRGLSNYKNLFNTDTLAAKFSQGGWSETIAEQYDQLILETLESGGQAAVDLLKKIKPDASSDELEAAFNSQINKLNDIMNQIDDLVAGQFVGTEGKLYEILKRAGAIDPEADGVVAKGFSMVKVYAAIYAEMSEAAGKTTAELNDVYAKLLTAQDQTNIDITEALQNGNGMSYADFGNLLAKYDIEFEKYMTDHLDTVMRDGFGNIRITDWEGFATNVFGKDFKALGIDQTPEYRKAYDSYVSGLVEFQNQPIELTNQVVEQIKNLSEAKPGQAVNISYLESILSDSTKELLKKYGSTVSQGVLTLGQGLKIPELMQSILKDAADAGVILEDQLVELMDTIEGMLSNMTSLIASGIDGSLSNADAFNLQTWAKDRGYIGQLDFTKTAEGLKLSADSALDLYNIVKDIDSIQGNIVFEKLQETLKTSKDEFKTATSQAAYLSSFQPDVFSTFKSLRGNVNMYNRPNIDIGNGEYSTIQGTGYDARLTRRNGDTFGVRLLMTPIPEWADGAEDILSDEAMGEYVDALVDQNPVSIDELIELDAKGIDINGEHYSNLLIDVKDASEVTREEFDKQAETLHELSDAWEQYYNTLSDAEKAQYDIAKQMALTSATSEDASFNFMDNAIPAGQNNPLNYYSSWGKAWKTLKDSFSSSTDTGMIDYQDFYNIMTEMGNIAAMSGQKIQIGADTFITDAESASAAITKGSQMLKVASDGSIKVDLSGFGIDFASGADSMAENVDAGIQAMAESQINMLDGLIQMLETIVAMEQLGDIEGGDGVIDFSDLFTIKEWDASSKQWNAEFSEGYDKFRNYVLERIDEKNEKLYNEDLAKGINNTKFKINDQEFIFGDLLKLDASELAEKANGDLGEAYAAVLQAYKKAALSGDYSEDNVFASLKEILASTGLEGEIQIGDMTLTLAYNTVLEKGKDGKYHIGDREFTEAKDAAQYQNEKEIANFIGAAKTVYDQNDGSIQIDQSLVTDIHYNADTGIYTVTFSEDGFSATSSTKEGIKAAIGTYAKLKGETINGDTSNSEPVTFTFQQGATMITEVQIQNGEIKLVNTNNSRYTDAKDIEAATQQWINEQTANQSTETEVTDSTTVKANQNVNLDFSGSTITPTGVPSEIEITDPLSLNFSKVTADLTQSASSIGQAISASLASGIKAGQQPIQNAIGSIETHIRELGDAANNIFNNLQALLRGLQQHISITGELSFETPFGTISGKSGFRSENGKVVIDLVGEEEIQKVKDEAAEPVKMTIDATADPAINILNELIAKIESTSAEASVDLSSQPSQIQSQINSRTYTASVQLQPTGGLVPHRATGNLGLAQAKGTLMGELGPELVVSNGRYFVAGQNGAEMVNLADDAIVFNHLQTEQLLKHGMSSGRGKAVTSEKNAVAFATGNTGPAMASASAALAALKNIRAMWQALQNVSVSDLAGAGGGGGGGGGDKAVDPSIWIDTVERWYNLMQKIAKLEKEITHEETLRSKLESDWNANGNHYYASQKRSLEALRDQIDAQEQLNLSRQAYYDQRVEALEKSPFGKLIRFDDEGQMFFQEGAMEWLTKLAGFDSEGKANYTDEEKYDILMKAGYGDYMKYDSDGGEIKKDSDGDGEVTDDELQTFYGNATQAFWDRINDYKETTQSLWDSIKDGEDSLLDLQADQNSLLEEIRDNQMEVEDQVLKAIEDLRQREIDALQDERDKLEESTQKYIDGLTDALNREQEMYQNQEDETNLNQQRRRLAILQRSGGSAEDIASLRSEIDSSERERYFNLQQQQIDAIQAASDLEIERMDSQIEIMTETLEYQKEYGLLWGNVYAVMQESADKIVSFITHGNSEFWASSELASQKAINEQLFAAEQWTSYREDLAAAKASIGENGVTAKDISENVQLMATMTREQMKDNDYRTFDEAMKKEFGNDYDKNGTYKDIFYSEYQEHGDLTKVTASARKKYSDDKKAAEANKTAVKAVTPTGSGGGSGESGGSGGSSGGSGSGNKKQTYDVYDSRGFKTSYTVEAGSKTEAQRLITEKYGSSYSATTHTNTSSGVTSTSSSEKSYTSSNTTTAQTQNQNTTRAKQESKGILPNTETAGSAATTKTIEQSVKTFVNNSMNFVDNIWKSLVGGKKASGGYVDHGIYELGERGTETVLTASQTKVLRDNILSNRPNSLISLLRSYNENYDGINSPLTGITPVEDNSVTIERVEMTMEVKQIANDYDAKRAGEQALNEMMRIARKTGATNSIRR